MAAHRYWRMRVTSHWGYAAVITGLELRLSELGPNLAVAGNGTPSSLSGTSANAFDANTGTEYYFGAMPGWLTWDFGVGNEKIINHFTIRNNSYYNYNAKDGEFQHSDDGVTYTTVYTFANPDTINTSNVYVTLEPALPGQHYFWRLTGFLTDSNALELSQAQLYDGATLITQVPTFSVAPTAGTAFPDVLHWDDFSMPGFALTWNLATPVANPNLRLGAGSGADNFPKEFYCQYSDDGKFWSTNNAPKNVAFPGAGLMTAEPSMGAGQSVFIPLSTTAAPKRWRVVGKGQERMAGAELPAHNLREVTAETSFMDAYHGGNGRLYGTVKEKHAPLDIPLRREVLLIDKASRLTIRVTWSDSITGDYEFIGIRMGVKYTVLAYDHFNIYRVVGADEQIPELML